VLSSSQVFELLPVYVAKHLHSILAKCDLGLIAAFLESLEGRGLAEKVKGGWRTAGLNHESEPARDSEQAARAFPEMCEEGLDERAQNWNADKRRRMALLFDRWTAQLRLSADVMEKTGTSLGEPCELVFPDQELQEEITGYSPAQCVALITKLEGWCEQIRIALGLDKTKAVAEKAERALFIWPS
jgi:hypothetical protein